MVNMGSGLRRGGGHEIGSHTSSHMTTIEQQLKWLRAWAVISSVLLGVLLLGAFRQQKQRFGEIDVERINVVEPDGKLRMVISNRPRSIGPIYKGEPFGYPGGTRPGIIFFNDEGTENGGLTFTGRTGPDGKYQASSHFSFDQFNQPDQSTGEVETASSDKDTGGGMSNTAMLGILAGLLLLGVAVPVVQAWNNRGLARR